MALCGNGLSLSANGWRDFFLLDHMGWTNGIVEGYYNNSLPPIIGVLVYASDLKNVSFLYASFCDQFLYILFSSFLFRPNFHIPTQVKQHITYCVICRSVRCVIIHIFYQFSQVFHGFPILKNLIIHVQESPRLIESVCQR